MGSNRTAPCRPDVYVDHVFGQNYRSIRIIGLYLDLQLDALKKPGCEDIFTDKISGSVSERLGLEKLDKYLRNEDVLVVWRLDRLGRSLKHLISYVSTLETKGVGFHSITESINSC